MDNRLKGLLNLEVSLATHRKLGYPIFESGNYNLNLVGYRSSNRVSNDFDDVIVVFYKVNDVWRYDAYTATLDPGITYLESPFSWEAKKDGAFIIARGHYPQLFAKGWFNGRECLYQRTPVRGYRDKNWNNILDLDPKTLSSGMYGILLHPHFQSKRVADKVWNSSAGCQVLQDDADFTKLMAICGKTVQLYGNKISYSVIEENEIVLPKKTV